MAEVIEVQIIADDSGLTSAFNNIADQAEEISSTAADVGDNIGAAFDGSAVQNFGNETSKATKATKNLGTETAKSTRSMSGFNRGAARGVSAVSRFGGAGGRATRSLAGFGTALASTPFGVFAIGAAAATAAISFLYDKFKDNSAEILQRNKELQGSIESLSATGLKKEVDIKLNAQDIKVALGLLTEAEAIDNKRALTAFAINEAEAERYKLALVAQKENNKFIDLQRKGLAQSEEGLKQQEKLIQAQNDERDARIFKQSLILKEQKLIQDRAKLDTDAAAERKKKEEEANKLINSLVRDELQIKINALEAEAQQREEKAKEVFKTRKEINDFIKESEAVLLDDIEKIKQKYADEEIKARKAVAAQLIIDEEEAAKQAAQDRADQRKAAIMAEYEDGQERIDLLKKNEDKLNADLSALTKQYAKQREEEKITADNKIFETELAKVEAQIKIKQNELNLSQEIARQKETETQKTEEQITEFQKLQAEERERLEIQSQIKRLEAIRDFNKQLTAEQKAATAAEIAALQVRLDGVGKEIKKAESGDGKTLGDLLGIGEDDQKTIKATQQALEKVTAEVSKAVAARIALIQQEIDKSKERIGELQSDLNIEIQLNKLGKASNIKELQEQLAEEKKALEKAEKEKEEAAKAQFILDTALQTSNLITAISGLYSSLSGLPFGIGVALATALSAVMIGSFIASKASAASAAGFAEGGYTGRGEKYEEAGTVHRGEWVIPKNKVTELGLEGVAVSDFDAAMLKRYGIPGAKNTGRVNKMIESQLNAQYANEKRQAAQIYAQTVKDAINGQNSILKGILNATENAPLVFPIENDKFLIQRGKNKTEIKRIKK